MITSTSIIGENSLMNEQDLREIERRWQVPVTHDIPELITEVRRLNKASGKTVKILIAHFVNGYESRWDHEVIVVFDDDVLLEHQWKLFLDEAAKLDYTSIMKEIKIRNVNELTYT